MSDPKIEVFTFGDPTPVLDQRDFFGYFHSAWTGSWYETPISFDGLAKALGANPHHQSAIGYKASLLASHFIPHPHLNRVAFKRLALDYLVFGNAYVEDVRSWLGNRIGLKPMLARWMRIKKDNGATLLVNGQEFDFEPGRIVHVQEPDINQEIYGLPGYTAAIQSALLNESATLFRRKYYQNGSHAGFILYLTDPANNPEDIDNLRKALKNSRGPGNFRNLFMYMPKGKKDGLQLIPIGEVTAKDEFFNMKNVTRDDILAAHRVPPQLLGIVPTNGGGFGSVGQAAEVFFANEITPLMTAFDAINEATGDQIVTFNPYTPTSATS